MKNFNKVALLLTFLFASAFANAQTPTANETLCLKMERVAPFTRITDCSAAISEKPANGKLYEMRAQAYGETKQLDKALADVNKVIQLTPTHADAYIFRAMVNYASGKPDAALVDFTKALEINPNNQNALFQRAAFYNTTGKKDLALADLRKLAAIAPGNPQVAAAIKQLEAAAQPYSYMGKQLAAPEQFLQEVANLENKNAQTYFGVTLASIPDEKFDPVAFDLLTNCFSRFPEHADCAKKLYDVYSRENLKNENFKLSQQAKWVEANLPPLYTALIKAEPQSHHYYFMRGMHYHYKLKNYPLAVADFTKAIELNTTKPSHYYDLRAKAYVEQKNYDAAIADYSTIISKADNLEVRRKRAEIYASQSKYDLAIADATKAVESATDTLNTKVGLYVRAKIYAQAEKHELAIADFSKIIQMDDQFDSAYIGRAKSYRVLGKTAVAALDEKRAEEIIKRREVLKGKN